MDSRYLRPSMQQGLRRTDQLMNSYWPDMSEWCEVQPPRPEIAGWGPLTHIKSIIYILCFLCLLHDFSEHFILNHIVWKHWSFLVFYDHKFSHLFVYMEKNEPLWVSVQPSGVSSWEKSPLRLPMQITWPCPRVSCFSLGLITVRQKKMWT